MDYREESIAFALALGIEPVFSSADNDAAAEKSRRRARFERKKAKR